jgi:hypothetical protein
VIRDEQHYRAFLIRHPEHQNRALKPAMRFGSEVHHRHLPPEERLRRVVLRELGAGLLYPNLRSETCG